ncbi:MAG: helicase-related protein [Limosilactobacillus sp.]|uniref:DEAD/DEAH box helicase n=1 Tax=Limosilactobacillus sp. TaxID=2773925 RepID=UPI0027087C36|nr:helicase-related protein [Limosilactobacillus sp.]
MNSDFYGRQVLVPRDQPSIENVQTFPTMEVRSTEVRCCRCNKSTLKEQAALPNEEYYCPQCLNLGRVSTLCKFYHVPEPNSFQVPDRVLTWEGQLSPLQHQAAESVKAGMLAHQRQLLWAVTGAGKTEMMFQGIAACLEKGERVAVASPRVDVCIELFPRFQKAFENIDIVLLHGRSDEPYRYAQLTICTTHQLLRFYHAFDNLVIDEVDAFPFAANPQLFYAANRSIKETGGQLFLTATPGGYLLRESKAKRLKTTYLPLRFHGFLLPTIRLNLARNWRTNLAKGRLPSSLIQQMRRSLKEGLRFLLFAPHVKDLPGVEQACKRAFPDVDFTTVHASDPDRLDKVQKMRDHEYQFLITTSILERGVTFPEIDVFVLGADDGVFSTAALVQIAGRAGRSASRPVGRVGFWIDAHSKVVNEAVRQVRYMNMKGKQCGGKVSSV